MSIPVDVADLEATLVDFGVGYLLSTDGEAVKAVSAQPRLRDGVLLVRGPGRGSLRNAGTRAAVTLLFPPLEVPGYTLLVDGTAEVAGDDLHVRPVGAVLHKPAEPFDDLG